MFSLYCAGTDLYALVNNDMVIHKAAVATKILVKSFYPGVATILTA